ncbi:uncharacterized protein LOC143446321 [Clavelina lepadiformis]|uniref:uncharacterized protein LOC143446321 n=1 Tax=Clavelina lepadiformis TaxID=159417 RepID=UPI0040426060
MILFSELERWRGNTITRSFPKAIVPDHHWRRPSTKESEESLTRVQNIIGDFDAEYTMKYYDYWSQHYEKDLEILDYKVPDFMASKLAGFLPGREWENPSHSVLDVGAGTGQMAIALKKFDFKGTVDALDGNTKMLEKAREKGLYKHLEQHLLMDDTPMTFASNTYDTVVCCCAMVPALIQPECLPDMVRVAKSGGRLYFTTRATDGNSTFRDRVDVQLNAMKESGLIRITAEDVIPQYSWPVSEGDDDKHCISAVAICLEKLKNSE